MITAKLSSKYQLAIPKVIRESLNLKAGQRFSLLTIGNIIELVPVCSVSDARGSFNDCGDYSSSDYRDRMERNL